MLVSITQSRRHEVVSGTHQRFLSSLPPYSVTLSHARRRGSSRLCTSSANEFESYGGLRRRLTHHAYAAPESDDINDY